MSEQVVGSSSATAAIHGEKLDSIQLMRAIAAVAVVTQHIPRLFGNGAWGVDLFFVISGFIMCFVTAKSSAYFFTKRLIRVAPLYWAGTFGAFFVALAMPSVLRTTSTSLPELFKSLAFIPFLKGDKVQPLLFLGWTLHYEMLFYALFAVSTKISQRYRAAVCSVLIVALVAFGYIFQPQWVVLSFYTSDIMLEFVFGMICYSLYLWIVGSVPSSSSRGARNVATLLGVGCIIGMILTKPWVESIGRVEARGILAGFTFLFLLLGLSGRRLPAILVLIGDASYSLYLFHPYVIQVFEKIFHSFNTRSVYSYTTAVFAIALCCLASLASYKYVEHPLTERLRSKLLPRRQRQPAPQNFAAESGPLLIVPHEALANVVPDDSMR